MGRGKEGGSRCFGLGGVPVSPLGEGGEGFRNVEAVGMSSFYYAEMVVIDGDQLLRFIKYLNIQGQKNFEWANTSDILMQNLALVKPAFPHFLLDLQPLIRGLGEGYKKGWLTPSQTRAAGS